MERKSFSCEKKRSFKSMKMFCKFSNQNFSKRSSFVIMENSSCIKAKHEFLFSFDKLWNWFKNWGGEYIVFCCIRAKVEFCCAFQTSNDNNVVFLKWNHIFIWFSQLSDQLSWILSCFVYWRQRPDYHCKFITTSW